MPFVVLVCALACWSSGSAIHLAFPTKAFRAVFLSSGLPDGVPSTADIREMSEFDLNTTGADPSNLICVWDRDTNRLATKKLSQAGAQWTLTDAAYTLLGSVVVRVESEGKPVAAASVSISDGTRQQNRTLDPSANGQLKFFAVKPGELKIVVYYSSLGKEAKPYVMKVELTAKSDKPESTFVASLSDQVDTVPETTPAAEASAPQEATKEAVQRHQRPYNWRNLIVPLVVTALIVVGLVVAFNWANRRSSTIATKLRNFGVPGVPDPSAPPADPGASTSAPAAAPPQKIMLPDSAPDPIGAAPIAAASRVAGCPTLAMSPGGKRFELQEGESTLGREQGLAVSLDGEQSISRRHAVFARKGTQVTVRDLGSTNGTYVNGSKIDDEVELRPGDTVQAGAIQFRYEV